MVAVGSIAFCPCIYIAVCSINNLRTVKPVEVKALRHSFALSLQACEVVKGFFGVPLDGFEASERERFVLPVMYLRLLLLTRSLSNFLLDSCREIFYAEMYRPNTRHFARRVR